MSKTKCKPKEESESKVSKAQHLCLNNLNMLMFYIKKKNLSEDYLVAISANAKEMLDEIKAL